MGVAIQPKILGGQISTGILEGTKTLCICFLANAASSHTAKWVNHFSGLGHKVHILSFEPGLSLANEVLLHSLKPNLPTNLRYFLAARQARKLVQEIRPDIVHAHYASGYGTLGRLTRFRPYVLSVWGSDVFDVPRKSAVHRKLLRENLQSADHLCSTSEVMARQTLRFSNRPITLTPFGVDCEQFRPFHTRGPDSQEFVIGTVKALEPYYGIEYLIRGFALLSEQYTGTKKLRLVIAGSGSTRGQLEKLARDLGIENRTKFIGNIAHERVPELLRTFSIFAALSLRESFGVAVLEASACGLPVVVTNVDGLPEVVRDGVTGLVVPPRDAEAAAAAFAKLIDDVELGRELGVAGRAFVLQHYEWSENASRMARVYDSLINGSCGADLSRRNHEVGCPDSGSGGV